MTTTTPHNAIDVTLLQQTVQAIGADADLGAFTFRATSRWQEGTHNVGEIGRFSHAGAPDESRDAPFVLHGDEPPVLLGHNKGPNAVELLLQALAFCYSVGFAANAAARGIEIDRMEYEVEGDLDVRAFLGLDGGRPGFGSIRAHARVSSNASPAEIAELCQYVQDTSPVRDVLANGVPVDTTLDVV